MSPAGWLAVALGIFCLYDQALTSKECNAYNFAMQGIAPCAMNWWQGNSFEQNTADLSPQLTDLVVNAMKMFGLDPKNITSNLNKSIQANSADALRKLIETIGLAEPYVIYMAMDGVKGFGMTADEMVKLGLPGSLAEDGNMRKLYQDYFSKSCSSDILRSLITCVDDWAASHCKEEDRASVITDMLSTMADYYCDNKVPKQELMTMMNEDFGKVYADVIKSFGIIKDPVSPYVFNIAPNSIIMNQTAALELNRNYMSTCGYLTESLYGAPAVGGDPFAGGADSGVPAGPGGGGAASGGATSGSSSYNYNSVDDTGTDFNYSYTFSSGSSSPRLRPAALGIMSMIDPTSNLGMGVVVDRLFRLNAQMTNCALRAWEKFQPGFFSDNNLMFSHIKIINARYSMGEPSLEEPELGDVRHTVMVYGDPHMKAYKIPGTLTCPALGWQTYLSNQFFKLFGNAEKACSSCVDATFVTSVTLNFPSQGVTYETQKTGEIPSQVLTSSADMLETFTEKDGIKLEVIESGVRITDTNSAAVFLFTKFRETYQIAIRMSESVFDNSAGLLILGCPNPIDIKATAAALRRKRDTSCVAACMYAPEDMRETCIFDCETTGDLEVANITISVAGMQTSAAEKDEEIFKMYPTTTAKNPAGSGTMFLPSLLMVVLMVLLPRLG